MLQRFLLGNLENLTNWKNADLNGNGVLDAGDFTLLKQQITGQKKTGGTLAVGVVDMMTGESVAGVRVGLTAICGEYFYDLGVWTSKENEVAYFSGLPTDDKYEFIIDCGNLPEGYGNEFGNWNQQLRFSFDGKTDMAVNARLIKNTDEKNVQFTAYDWAWDKEVTYEGFNQYCLYDVRTKDGTPFYGVTPYGDFALPDGEYHVDAIMHPCPLTLMDPDSEFAAHIKEIHPDVEFTDQTHGIDFAVVNGKMDREVQFDFSPLPDKSNSIQVTCTNSETGEPMEGVQISIIEAPDSYAKTVATWTSDSTGTHLFEGLMRAGDQWNPAYIVRVDKTPKGFVGGYDDKVSAGYVYGYIHETNFSFSRNTMPSIQGATVINFEDGTVCNDLDTYDIWRIDPTDRDKLDRMYADLKPGESFILPEGKYFAAMNGSEAAKKGLAPITFFSEQGKSVADFFDQEYYCGGSGYIEFNVSDGEADKELVFYVMNNRWIEDDRALTPEEIAKYEAVWGDTAENLNLPTSGK